MCQDVEGGFACGQYWPLQDVNEGKLEFDDVTVTLIKQEEVCPLLIISKLEIEVRYADGTI